MLEKSKQVYANLFKGVFSKSHGIFAGGSALAMIFPVLSAPILSRLYAPEDFGAYAIYFGVSSILIAVSSLSLQNAINLESDKWKQIQMTITSIVIGLLFSVILLAMTPVVEIFINEKRHNQFGRMMYFMPITVALGTVTSAIYVWATKNEEYSFLGKNKLILAALTTVAQISIGWGKPGWIGFILSNIIGSMLAVAMLVNLFRSKKMQYVQNQKYNWTEAVVQIRKYKKLIVWTTPSTLLNTFCNYIPDFIIGRIFGMNALGQYSLATRMVGLPIGFIATSVQEIFRQKATDEFQQTNSVRITTQKFAWILCAFSILGIIPVLLAMPILFPFIFGGHWDQAGQLVVALGILVTVRFVSSPISYVWIIYSRQRLDFIWQIGLVFLTVISLGLPYYYANTLTLIETIQIFSCVVGTWYVVCIIITIRLSRLKIASS